MTRRCIKSLVPCADYLEVFRNEAILGCTLVVRARVSNVCFGDYQVDARGVHVSIANDPCGRSRVVTLSAQLDIIR
jgi:hypothetical protein